MKRGNWLQHSGNPTSQGKAVSRVMAQLKEEAAETPEQRCIRVWTDAMSKSDWFANLILTAFEIEPRVLEVLERSGPVGDDHQGLIRLMSLSFSSYLLDEQSLAECYRACPKESWLDKEPGRVAWSVAVGGGKTLGAASLCRAVTDILAKDPKAEGHQSRGILYSAKTIKLLDNMLKALDLMGVPRSEVGVFHSKEQALVPSIDATDIGRYPVLLCTQQMLQAASERYEAKRQNPGQKIRGVDLEELLVFKGKDRLAIWDEAFMSSLADSADLDSLELGIGSLRERVNNLDELDVIELESTHGSKPGDANRLTKPAGKALLNLLSGIHRNIQKNAKAQKQREPITIRLPSVDEIQAEQIANVAGWLKRLKSRGPADAMEAMAAMCSAGGLEVAVLKGKGQAIIRPRIVISDRLKRLVVLDAGYVTSTISQMEPTVKLASAATYAGRELQPKLFDNVNVRFYLGHSGRGDVKGLGDTRTRLKQIKEQVDRIARVPLGEKSLVVTFTKNDSGIDFKGEIEAELDRSCPGWSNAAGGSPRVTVITWGEHVGMNCWRDCQHLFFVGVLRRMWSGDLMTEAWAASRANAEAYKAVDPLQVEANQAGQEIMQAIGRGNARSTINGHAGKMAIHIPYKESHPRYQGMAPCEGSPLWTELARMMPGCVLQSESQPPKESGYEQAAKAANQILSGLTQDSILTTELLRLIRPIVPELSEGVLKDGIKQLAIDNNEIAQKGQSCWIKPTPTSRRWIRVEGF